MDARRVAVLVSGSGTNLQALMDACETPEFPARIVAVISNKADAYALVRAKKASIPTFVVSNTDYPTREAFDAALQEVLLSVHTEIVCLAGFMRILTPGFVSQWEGKMLNIHPSLLPAFPGLHTHAQALKAGVKMSGCTVHLVTAELDSGPIIIQAEVPVEPNDTPETLAARVLVMEHKIYPQALRWLAEGKVKVVNGRAVVDGQAAPVKTAFEG